MYLIMLNYLCFVLPRAVVVQWVFGVRRDAAAMLGGFSRPEMVMLLLGMLLPVAHIKWRSAVSLSVKCSEKDFEVRSLSNCGLRIRSALLSVLVVSLVTLLVGVILSPMARGNLPVAASLLATCSGLLAPIHAYWIWSLCSWRVSVPS
jgi:hypothetical protein